MLYLTNKEDGDTYKHKTCQKETPSNTISFLRENTPADVYHLVAAYMCYLLKLILILVATFGSQHTKITATSISFG
jgi:hypothetical protein